jgi:hypothetical protein
MMPMTMDDGESRFGASSALYFAPHSSFRTLSRPADPAMGSKADISAATRKACFVPGEDIGP